MVRMRNTHFSLKFCLRLAGFASESRLSVASSDLSSVAYVLSCGAQDSVALHSRGEHLLNTRYGQSLSSGSLLLGEQWSTAVVIQVIIQVIETIRETETGKLGPKVLTLVVSK